MVAHREAPEKPRSKPPSLLEPNTRRTAARGCRAPWFGVFPGTYQPTPSRASTHFPGVIPSAGAGHICVCVPCYNEEAGELHRSLGHLAATFAELRAARGVTASVCVIVDGWGKASESMKEYVRDCFPDDSHAPWWDRVYACDEEGETVTYAVQNRDSARPGCAAPVVLPDLVGGGSSAAAAAGGRALDLALVIKGDNRGKTNSHEWFFRAYVRRYPCDYTLLTDCGTLLAHDCARELYDFMETRPQFSASSGFQRAQTLEEQSGGARRCESPLAMLYRQAQMFDHEAMALWLLSAYSQLGFMPVLPGPCQFLRSADALPKDGPIDEYLKVCKRANADRRELLYRNLKITEDRVLSYTMVSQGVGKQTGLVPSADFIQDAQTDSWSFLAQRRRWNNGTMSAAVVVLFAEPDLMQDSGHGCGFRAAVRGMLGLELLQYGMSLLAPSVLVTVLFSIGSDYIELVPRLALWGWGGGYMAVYALFVAVHHRRRFVGPLYHLFCAVNVATILAIAAAIAQMLLDVVVGGNGDFRAELIGYATLAIGLMGVVCPVLVAAAYGRWGSVCRLLLTSPAYLLLTPVIGPVFQSYSMARTWDVSWGNRPATHTGLADEELDEEEHGHGAAALGGGATEDSESAAAFDLGAGGSSAGDLEWGLEEEDEETVAGSASRRKESAESSSSSSSGGGSSTTGESSAERQQLGGGSSSGRGGGGGTRTPPSKRSYPAKGASGGSTSPMSGDRPSSPGSARSSSQGGEESDATVTAEYIRPAARKIRPSSSRNSNRQAGSLERELDPAYTPPEETDVAPVATVGPRGSAFGSSSSLRSKGRGLVKSRGGKGSSKRVTVVPIDQCGNCVDAASVEKAPKPPNLYHMRRVSAVLAAAVVLLNMAVAGLALWCGLMGRTFWPTVFVLSLAVLYGVIGCVKLVLALAYSARWLAAGGQRRRASASVSDAAGRQSEISAGRFEELDSSAAA